LPGAHGMCPTFTPHAPRASWNRLELCHQPSVLLVDLPDAVAFQPQAVSDTSVQAHRGRPSFCRLQTPAEDSRSPDAPSFQLVTGGPSGPTLFGEEPNCAGLDLTLNSPLFRGPFLAILSPTSHHLGDLRGGDTRRVVPRAVPPFSGIAQMVSALQALQSL
jgi:hypothetical protein